MTSLRNEAVLCTFTKERQMLENTIDICKVDDPEAVRLCKLLRKKCDMICHTKMIEQNHQNEHDEMDEETNDGELLHVSNFILNHF